MFFAALRVCLRAGAMLVLSSYTPPVAHSGKPSEVKRTANNNIGHGMRIARMMDNEPRCRAAALCLRLLSLLLLLLLLPLVVAAAVYGIVVCADLWFERLPANFRQRTCSCRDGGGRGRVDRDAVGAGAARTALFAAIKNLHKYTEREHRQINFGL